jgi:hypothetical protein
MGEQAHRGKKAHFSFEILWLKHEGFHNMVAREWAAVSHGNSSLVVWQNNRHLRHFKGAGQITIVVFIILKKTIVVFIKRRKKDFLF